MRSLHSEKLEQAIDLVRSSEFDLWLTFVRETGEGGDPVLSLIIEGGLTWLSALLVTKTGRRVALVGRHDADPLRAGKTWDDVIGYDEGIREPLLGLLEQVVPSTNSAPKIAVNYSTSDDKADGLTHGMYLLLKEYFQGTRFEESLGSSEEILATLRARKTPSEVAAIRSAIVETESLFDEVERFASPGTSEREIYEFVQKRIEAAGLGYSWNKTGNPIVNIGSESMIGHGIPSSEIVLEPGQVLHIDLGIVANGYSSDIQRCWFLPGPNEREIPDELVRAVDAVNAAISSGADVLRPGVEGWEVDAAGRTTIKQLGYEEYQHALGHQVGRTAHDGGTVLGPRWERYGRLPFNPVQAGEVYTLELGVLVEGRGFIGIEEMVRVTDIGCEWLTTRQTKLRYIGQDSR